MIHPTLDEAHPPQKRPQDTAIGQAWVKALTPKTKQPKGRKDYKDYNIKPNTKAEPVRAVVAIVSFETEVEVVDFYGRKPC